MSNDKIDVTSEIVQAEVRHVDAGNPPIRYLALRLTTEGRSGVRSQGEWAVLAPPLAEKLVAAIQSSLNAPQSQVGPTTTSH